MRVLVLGGGGFLGSALTEELCRRGHEVAVTSRSADTGGETASASARRRNGGSDPRERSAVVPEGESAGQGRWPGDICPGMASLPELRCAGDDARGEGRSASALREKGSGTGRGAGAERAEAVVFSSGPDVLSERDREARRRDFRKGGMVRDIVEAASAGEKPSPDFWLASEALGRSSGHERDGYFFPPASERTFSGAERRSAQAVRRLRWDAMDAAALVPLLDGVDAVVGLCGEYLGGRWSSSKKAVLRGSRTVSGQALAQALAVRSREGAALPEVVVQASSVSWYGTWRYFDAAPVCAEDMPHGSGFLASLTAEWERAVRTIGRLSRRVPDAELPAAPGSQGKDRERVRLCVARLAPVLGKGGFLRHVLPLFRAGFGGVPGSGLQPFPWIHLRDAVRALIFLLEKPASGAYNLCSPGSGTMREFCEGLGWALQRPVWLPMPEVSLRLTLGDLADELLLAGQRVEPLRLREQGFRFDFPELDAALAEVLG